MTFGLVDIIILLFILLGAVIGFKEGVIKKTTSIVGLLLVVILSFVLKNYLSSFFYENLPFFKLWGVFKGIQVLNIIFYEMVAFLIIASVLTVIYNLILGITGLIEKILKATIILSIPSKLLGILVGALEAYIWIYLALFVLTLPVFNIKPIYESKTSMFILEKLSLMLKVFSCVFEVANIEKSKNFEPPET